MKVKRWMRATSGLSNTWIVVFALLVVSDLVPWPTVSGVLGLAILGLIAWDIVHRYRHRRNYRLWRGDMQDEAHLDVMIQGLTNTRAFLEGRRAAMQYLRRAKEDAQ